jgi:hypothetical protein
MRTVAAVVHAAPGVVGLVAGLLSLAPPRAEDRRGGWRLIHAVCVATLLGGLVALVVYDWRELDAVARTGFLALVGLAGVMGYRLHRAWREASRQSAGHTWPRRSGPRPGGQRRDVGVLP